MLNQTKIICSVTDRKPFVACGFCGVKISPVIGYNTINNRVNRERKACRAKYFKAKVEHLKECKPSAWWSCQHHEQGLSLAHA